MWGHTDNIRNQETSLNRKPDGEEPTAGKTSPPDSLQKTSQKCYSPGCRTCPVLFDFDTKISVNGQELQLDVTLTCKDRHIICIAQCQRCNRDDGREDTFFGQTLTQFHTRLNGHRHNLVIDERAIYEHSALSMHCYTKHRDNFCFDCFKFRIAKKTKPTLLDMEEATVVSHIYIRTIARKIS